VKHVFVETNFLIEVARPFPGPRAEALLKRGQAGAVQLHIPWCSVEEAKRTLVRIIEEDLGFTSAMMKFASRAFLADPSRFAKVEVDKLKVLAEVAKAEAIRTKDARVDAFAANMEVILPSQAVISTTLAMFDVKSLKPFDEMAAGAILTRAGELYAAGERELFFCTLDKDDLAPSDGRPKLKAVYDGCGLRFLSTFEVPP
jgi:hypothetical protein